MPPLSGFSDNPFVSREDFEKAALALVEALCKHQSPGYARIKIPVATATHFDEIAAQLEGYARSLWAVAPLLVGNSSSPTIQALAGRFAIGLANGTNPNHVEYWKPLSFRDQRKVEMGIISFALLTAPDIFFHNQENKTKANIIAWLDSLNGKDFGRPNWLWSRVFTNLALVKTCGVPLVAKKASIDADLTVLDKFHIGKGWQSDGPWDRHADTASYDKNDNGDDDDDVYNWWDREWRLSDDSCDDGCADTAPPNEDKQPWKIQELKGRQADYYSSSFAIQFSRLLFTVHAAGIDPVRCDKYKRQAQKFSKTFWHYFDQNGAAIPFGRSLTYRFAMAGFWSTTIVAELSLPSPLNHPGIVKGILLRHLRWWAQKEDMFSVDGTLNIGFAYPNMYMSEDYNSPQSVYWCLITFVALLLPVTHEFWTCLERPLPDRQLCQSIRPPLHIVCDTGRHHFLLSSGQFCPWPLKATEAKYGKFAYSSHFGFSVPTGVGLPHQPPDNTLMLSRHRREGWLTHRIATYPRLTSDVASFERFVGVRHVEQPIPTLVSTWDVFVEESCHVLTILIPPIDRWPDWHVRVHIIYMDTNGMRLEAVEGGFAIEGTKNEDGQPLPKFYGKLSEDMDHPGFVEGIWEDDSDGSLVCSRGGVSGIRNLNWNTEDHEQDLTEFLNTHAGTLKPDANTNIIAQKTLIPILEMARFRIGRREKCVIVTGVFAMAKQSEIVKGNWSKEVRANWNDPPIVRLSSLSGDDQSLYDREDPDDNVWKAGWINISSPALYL